MTRREARRMGLPKHCECGGLMLYSASFGRVFSCCDTCTPVVKVDVRKLTSEPGGDSHG